MLQLLDGEFSEFARTEINEYPGARISGLIRPSFDGP
jgi:hypothetical protein